MKARNDVRAVCSKYKSLIPKAETFIFNDGSSKELICLDGECIHILLPNETVIPNSDSNTEFHCHQQITDLNGWGLIWFPFVTGTIPVRYKGNNYNFPVRIWVLDTHPYHAPLCFVCPTPTMQIKVSRYVDESGRVYLPYLHDWNVNQGSDLLGVVQV